MVRYYLGGIKGALGEVENQKDKLKANTRPRQSLDENTEHTGGQGQDSTSERIVR